MCAINTAKELLDQMRLGCYTIEVKGGVLEVSPAFSIDDDGRFIQKAQNRINQHSEKRGRT